MGQLRCLFFLKCIAYQLSDFCALANKKHINTIYQYPALLSPPHLILHYFYYSSCLSSL